MFKKSLALSALFLFAAQVEAPKSGSPKCGSPKGRRSPTACSSPKLTEKEATIAKIRQMNARLEIEGFTPTREFKAELKAAEAKWAWLKNS